VVIEAKHCSDLCLPYRISNRGEFNPLFRKYGCIADCQVSDMYLIMLKDKKKIWVTLSEVRDLQLRGDILYIVRDRKSFQEEITLSLSRPTSYMLVGR